jgi:transposase-like protein
MGMSEVGKKVAEIFYWKCPRCGKTIESLYEPQLKANIEAHKRKCGGG